MAKPVLGYWDIRGFAEPARLMLEYLEIPFEDKRYICGDGPTFDRSCWLDVKFTIGLAFPNLPYYIDGDAKLTESGAILRHIARSKQALLPAGPEEDRCNIVDGVMADIRRDFLTVCYRPGFEQNKAAFYEKTFPTKMKYLNEYLKGKAWLGGENLTFVDFAFAEILDQMRMMQPGCFSKYENVCKYVNKFFKLEKIAAYRESDRFKKYPVNNKMAQWGGQAEAS